VTALLDRTVTVSHVSTRYSRYLDYSSSQNAKVKATEVMDMQRKLCRHDYEIDVIEEISPLQRVSQ